MPDLQTDVPSDYQGTSVRDIFQFVIPSLFSAESANTSLPGRFSLLEHADNKHKKGLADCFPGVSV
jgi:hypothetical protein